MASLSQLTLRQLEYIVAVADTGTISGAAARTCVSQSAVSLALSGLERAVGVQLLLRDRGRGSALTAAGRRLATDARAVLDAVGDLAAGARGLGHDLAGSLNIGCYTPIAPFYLPRALAGFRDEHPEVEVRFVEGTLPDLQEQLLAGHIELAFLYPQDLMPGIAVDVLRDQPPHALLPEGHPLVAGPDVSLADLSAEPFVMLDVPPSERYFRSLFDDAGLTVRVVHRASSFELARSLVARGLGCSLLVQRADTDSTYDGLPVVTRPLRDSVRTTPVVMGRPATAALSRRAETFRRFCVALFQAPAG